MMMNLNEIRQVSLYDKIPLVAHLRRLASVFRTASRVSVFKVAERWLLAAGEAELDSLARLQVLEGAAGENPWTWSRDPRRGLALAMRHFADHPEISKLWFSRGDTGMVGLIKAKAQASMRQLGTGVGQGADDIINNVLMGMGSSGGLYSKGPSLVGVGVTLRDSILSGKETPASVGAGLGARQAIQRALDEVKKHVRSPEQRGQQVRDDDETGQIEDPTTSDPQSFTDYMISKLMVSDAQGRALQRLLENSAKDEKDRAIIDAFLAEARKTEGHRSVGQIKKDLGKQIGMNEASVNARMVRNIIPRFKAVLEKTQLYTKLIEQYQLMQRN